MKIKELKDYSSFSEFLLGPFRERPGMYISDCDIDGLVTFLSGLSIGYGMANPENKVKDDIFSENGFLLWYQKFHPGKSYSRWSRYFLEAANKDGKIAFKLFFEYLEKFSNIK